MQPFKKPLLALTVLASLLTLSLTGCSNNPYPPGESDGNVLYRTLSDDFKSLDPSFSYTVDEAWICDLIYPSFYKYHYLKRDPFVLELNIGAKEPERKPWDVTFTDEKGVKKTVKGERYSFTFKKDLRFQDDKCFPNGKGRAITAKDVEYSFKRMADPTIQCPVASYFADKIAGWNTYSKGFETEDEAKIKAQYDKPMAGVEVDPKDPYTLHIYLVQPYPQLRFLMGMHFTTPQAREAVEFYGKTEYARHPVGSGPYFMSEYKTKQRVVLKANPNRHKDFYPTEGMPDDKANGLLDDAGKPLPMADKIVFSVVRESTSAWNLFQQGYLDAAAVNNNNFQQVMAAGNSLSPALEKKGVKLRKDTEMCVYYLAFNMNDPVFGGLDEKHKKLRQAISLSIDAQEYIDILLQGNGTIAQWVLPPGVFGYDPKYVNPYRTTNLEKAKKLLAEAGYPNGIDPKTDEKLVLHYDNTGTNAAGRQQVAIVSRQIERIGIKVESRPSLGDVFQEKLLKGQHQFIFYGWFADYPDPENFVFLLYGPNKRPGPNSANYINPAYDKLFEKMQVMDDGPEREAVIKQMRDIQVEDCAWIPVFHRVVLSLNYDWLKNVKAHPLANDYTQYRRVDVAERTRKQKEWNSPNFLPLVLLATGLILLAIPAANVVKQRVNRKVRVAETKGEDV